MSTGSSRRSWVGTKSNTVHDTVISSGEWIYTGVSGDENTDPASWADSNFDFTEVRITGDTLHLFGLFVMADLTDSRAPHVAMGIDVDRDGSDGGMDWCAPDDDMTNGYAGASQYSETNASFHVTPQSNWTAPDIEFYAQDGYGVHGIRPRSARRIP